MAVRPVYEGAELSTDRLLEARGLRVWSRGHARRRTIVSGIDLVVGRGDTVGIVGESGSGKSMTARAIMGLLPYGVEAAGEIRFAGVDLLELPGRAVNRLRGRRLAMLFQDPFTMLNPLLRAGAHIEEGLRPDRRRRSGKREREEALRRLAEVGIHDPAVADRYPFQLSGGMRQRVALAAALARDPDLLIADEPSTALDVTTQAEILELMRRLQESRGMGLILITHDLRVAFSVCDRIHVMYAGTIVEEGDGKEIERRPLHPYTLGLLLSEPPIDRRLQRLVAIDGSVPAPDDVPKMCAFTARCRWAEDRCRLSKPALVEVEPHRRSACVRIDEIRPDLARLRSSASAHPSLGHAGTTIQDPLVRVENLVKTFDLRARRVLALKSVTLEIGRNESVGLVGESGSGKTTLGRCLVGLERPTQGRIVIDGVEAHDYRALRATDRAKLRRTAQIVFQDPYSSLNPAITVGATLTEALKVGGRDPGSGVHDLLSKVGLPVAYAGRKPAALSGGERQRVAIARTLAVGPQLLVCDEPVSALDVSVQAQILNLFKSLRHELGLTYLFISHDLAVVRQVVDRIYVMYRGEIVETGPAGEVLDDPQHPYTQRLIQSIPRPMTPTAGPAP